MKKAMSVRSGKFVMSALLFLTILLISHDVAAQQGVTQALVKIKNTLYLVGNAIFGILLIIGIVKVVSGFITNSQSAVRNLIYLIIGVAIWFFFNYMIEDLAGLIGGDGGSFNR